MADEPEPEFQSQYNSGKSNIDIPEMMRRLDKLYDDEEKLLGEARQHQEAIRKLNILYNQKREEIDLMQNMIMHMSNKKRRQQEWDRKV